MWLRWRIRVAIRRCGHEVQGRILHRKPGIRFHQPHVGQALIRLAPADLEFVGIQIGDLPLDSRDYDCDDPAVERRLKGHVASMDALLFMTPEYNRSLPDALKNAVDWASRPWGQNSPSREPSASIEASPGSIGTAVAQPRLKSILSYCNSPQMNAVEAYIQFKPEVFTDEGVLDEDRHIPA